MHGGVLYVRRRARTFIAFLAPSFPARKIPFAEVMSHLLVLMGNTVQELKEDVFLKALEYSAFLIMISIIKMGTKNRLEGNINAFEIVMIVLKRGDEAVFEPRPPMIPLKNTNRTFHNFL